MSELIRKTFRIEEDKWQNFKEKIREEQGLSASVWIRSKIYECLNG